MLQLVHSKTQSRNWQVGDVIETRDRATIVIVKLITRITAVVSVLSSGLMLKKGTLETITLQKHKRINQFNLQLCINDDFKNWNIGEIVKVGKYFAVLIYYDSETKLFTAAIIKVIHDVDNQYFLGDIVLLKNSGIVDCLQRAWE